MLKKIVFPLLLLVSVAVASIFLTPYLRQLSLTLGITKVQISIAGTGSMYPTFPKGAGATDIIKAQEIVAWPQMQTYPGGINLFGFDLFSYKLSHGDIVEIENGKTKQLSLDKYKEEAGFVKRVVALPGDTISLRDGFVSLNGKVLDEPYTAKPRSTYGGEFLPDCKTLTIPKNSVFVMGDNRKASLDSRFELGLVNTSDIHFVLPWSKQAEYKKSFRDAKNDLSYAHTTTLDPEEFVRLLNDKRQGKKLPAYKYNPLLSASSKRRGYVMIATDDFSTEASRSGVTLAKAVKEAGYQNVIFAEVFTRGFYEADELLDNFAEFPETQKILYSAECQDIGLSPVLGEIGSCPVQVVVVHFGGYVPPNYSKGELDSWQKLISNIEEVLPSWRVLKGVEGIDQNKLNQLLEALETRLSHAKEINAQMQKNLWLTDAEKKWVEDDKKLGMEAERIIGELKK